MSQLFRWKELLLRSIHLNWRPSNKVFRKRCLRLLLICGCQLMLLILSVGWQYPELCRKETLRLVLSMV